MINKEHPLYKEDLEYILSTKGIETLRNKSILITGATGMIGVCMIDALMLYNQRGANITIYAIGRNREKARERIGEYYTDDHFEFLEQDVRDPLPTDIKVDIVIPLASNTHPVAYSQYPIETIEINVKGCENALKRALECSAVVLYPSTVEVYGNARGDENFTEDYTGILNLANARSCYNESKRISEALCQSYLAERGVNVKIARLCRVFGATMLPNDTKASSQFIVRAARKENIILKSDGMQYFSYIYVADAVSALLYILTSCETGVPYNVANSLCNVRLKEFAETCAQCAGQEVTYDMPSEAERKGFSVATKAIQDTTRLTRAGWAGSYTMSDAIERTISILRQV